MRTLRMRGKERGQSLVFVGLLIGLGVLIGFVALATDGGSALVQRRNMQNGADSAALGAVNFLQASIIFNNGVPSYSATNENVAGRVTELLQGNRGGTTGTPAYRATLEYATYITATNTYSYSTAATYDAGIWTYVMPYQRTVFVPVNVDAVRVIAAMDNPTTFGRAIGINSIPVSARAAAALVNAANYRPEGPTWPMTHYAATATPDPNSGWCNPWLFWSNDGSQNFRNVLQLGAAKGRSYTCSTPGQPCYDPVRSQLILQPDERQPMADSSGKNYTNCNGEPGILPGMWSPAGNCSDTTPGNHAPNDLCCSTSANTISSDIPNWLTNDWQGRVSTTKHWDASVVNSYPASDSTGDWVEVYNAGNIGENISQPLQDYITAHGLSDAFAPWYGRYVDKIMYTYDLGQEWRQVPNDSGLCDPGPPVRCPYRWQAVNVLTRPPQRVHVNQGVVFRFYYMLAGQHGNVPKPTICGGGTVQTGNSMVYGVFVGAVAPGPPPNPGPHGLYNYIGYIDPGG